MSSETPSSHSFGRKALKAVISAIRSFRGHSRDVGSRVSRGNSTNPRDDLFLRALDVPSEKREAFLNKACADDAALRHDVASLLDAHDPARAYFDRFSEDVVVPVLSAIVGPEAEADFLQVLGGELADRYRIERELAGSGMSRVFVAEDLRLARRIVIKVVTPELATATDAEHVCREIEFASRLQHPHIVPLLDTGSADGRLYYTMPFIEGESLRDRLARVGSLPVHEAVRVWRHVLDALTYAHANGVIHLDVKPGNILLTSRHALVTDFGISRAIEAVVRAPGATPPASMSGTPAYMAPEESGGSRRVDPRVDIYAAGVVMYEMLAGSRPFGAESQSDQLLAHRTESPPALIAPNASRKLILLVMQCLAKDPRDRPQSAEGVLAELDLEAAAAIHSRNTQNSIRRTRRNATVLAGLLGAIAIAVTVFVFRPNALSGPADAYRQNAVSNIAAHEWYLRGMDVALLRTDEGRRQGVDHFMQAISIDSNYVDAYAGLVRMYVQLSNAAVGADRQEWLVLARNAALKAATLDDADASARAALGWVHLLSGDYRTAESEFTRAIALDSSVPRAHEGLARVYMMTGRPVEQMVAAVEGLALAPFSHSAIREMALALAMNGRCEESLDQLLPLKSLSPPAGVAGVIRGQCFASRAMWTEAIAEFRWAADNSATAGLALLGYALARAGQTDEATLILGDLTAGREYSHGSWGIAVVYTGLRNYDQAFTWLDIAVDDGSISFYVVLPLFSDLHQDPRFERLAKRMRGDA